MDTFKHGDLNIKEFWLKQLTWISLNVEHVISRNAIWLSTTCDHQTWWLHNKLGSDYETWGLANLLTIFREWNTMVPTSIRWGPQTMAIYPITFLTSPPAPKKLSLPICIGRCALGTRSFTLDENQQAELWMKCRHSCWHSNGSCPSCWQYEYLMFSFYLYPLCVGITDYRW